MKVIVAGSRSFDNYELLSDKLLDLYGYYDEGLNELCVDSSIEIISGCARGADNLGEEWARIWKVPVIRMPADWDKYGLRAGIIRNGEMAKNADVLVAFWDGASSGTRHMIHTALKSGLEVHVYRFRRKHDTTRQDPA